MPSKSTLPCVNYSWLSLEGAYIAQLTFRMHQNKAVYSHVMLYVSWKRLANELPHWMQMKIINRSVVQCSCRCVHRLSYSLLFVRFGCFMFWMDQFIAVEFMLSQVRDISFWLFSYFKIYESAIFELFEPKKN